MLNLDITQIFRAQNRLDGVVWKTPCECSSVLTERTGSNVYLKYECLQRTGSFKIRGAWHKIASLSAAEKKRGIVTASAGNHAQGVGMAVTEMDIPARIYVPENVPENKLKAIQEYQVEVVVEGRFYDDAHQAAIEDAERSDRIFIPAFEDPLIMAGHGTLGLEMLSQVPELDAALIPVGGGGLICGVATALKTLNSDIRIVGCQSSASCAMTRSLIENRPYLTFPSRETIAEGLEGGVSEITFELGRRFIDQMIVVEEDEIRSAIRFLLENHRVVVEGSGAVGVAALLHGRWSAPDSNVGVLLSGGNLDFRLLREIVREDR